MLLMDVSVVGYIDPTASGTLLQVLLGGTAALVLVRQFVWSRITGLWKRAKREPQRD